MLSGGPADYFRVNETGVSEAVNEVNGGVGAYNAVTLGQPDRSRSHRRIVQRHEFLLQLPSADMPTTGPARVSVSFKMPKGSTAGGILYGYRACP